MDISNIVNWIEKVVLIAVQHIVDISNIVNWIEKIVFQLTCHRQLKPLTAVLKYRHFVFIEKKCGTRYSVVSIATRYGLGGPGIDGILLCRKTATTKRKGLCGLPTKVKMESVPKSALERADSKLPNSTRLKTEE